MKSIWYGLGAVGLWAVGRELAQSLEQHIAAGDPYAMLGAAHVAAAGCAAVLAYIAVKPHITNILLTRGKRHEN